MHFDKRSLCSQSSWKSDDYFQKTKLSLVNALALNKQ